MYVPYLRGKQHELLMLRTLAEKLGDSRKVVPIIEPVVAKGSALKRALDELRAKKAPHVLLRNPLVGAVSDGGAAARSLHKALGESEGSTIDGFAIGPRTTLSEIQGFFRGHGDRLTALVHWTEFHAPAALKAAVPTSDFRFHAFIDGKTSTAYRDSFRSAGRVLIGDGFKAETRNADYVADELFSDLNVQYRKLGYQGFGDFQMVGEKFKDSGGPAHAVCIHLTYQRPTKVLGIRHFVSDTTTIPPADSGMKFVQALMKLVKSVDRDRVAFGKTTAVERYRDLLQRRDFPGLGKVKELSMQHHVELILGLTD